MEKLLKSYFGETAQLATVQTLCTTLSQKLNGTHADAQMLINAFTVKVIGHARQFDLSVQWFIAHAQKCAVRHTKAKPVCSDGRTLHIQGNGTALAKAPLWQVVG